jgi:hypothetical protein
MRRLSNNKINLTLHLVMLSSNNKWLLLNKNRNQRFNILIKGRIRCLYNRMNMSMLILWEISFISISSNRRNNSIVVMMTRKMRRKKLWLVLHLRVDLLIVELLLILFNHRFKHCSLLLLIKLQLEMLFSMMT